MAKKINLSFTKDTFIQLTFGGFLIGLFFYLSSIVYDKWEKLKEYEIKPLQDVILINRLSTDSMKAAALTDSTEYIFYYGVVIHKDDTINDIIHNIDLLRSEILQAEKEGRNTSKLIKQYNAAVAKYNNKVDRERAEILAKQKEVPIMEANMASQLNCIEANNNLLKVLSDSLLKLTNGRK